MRRIRAPEISVRAANEGLQRTRNGPASYDQSFESAAGAGRSAAYMTGDIRGLIPRNKVDLATARAAVDAGYPAVAPILPELLEWMQDYNWPVAGILAPFLASVGEPLVPHVRRVLASDDDVWKYWMISVIMELSLTVAEAFRDELKRLANAPTQREAREELDVVARDVLEKYGWV